MGSSRLWNFTCTEYLVLGVMQFLIFASDGAMGYQFTDYSLCLSSCGVLPSSPMPLRNRIPDHGFNYFIDGCALSYTCAYVALKRSADEDWTSWVTNERWNYFTHDSGSVYELPNVIGQTPKQDPLVTSFGEVCCNWPMFNGSFL